MVLHLYKKGIVRVFFVLFTLFFSSLFFSTSTYAAKACGETGCDEYGCNSGLSCRTSTDKCGIKYNTCSGAICQKDSAWDTSSPCNTADECTPSGTTRTASWGSYGACSPSCGVGTQTRTCNCGSENDCTVQCSSPTADCGDLDSRACCTSEAPKKPTISTPTTGANICSKNGNVTITWTYDNSTGCGAGWGYACTTPGNTFSIIDATEPPPPILSGIVPISSPQTQVVNLEAGPTAHLIRVCAHNGSLTTCSDPVSITVTLDTTAPPVPVPTVAFITPAACPGKYNLVYSWKAVSDTGCATMNSLPYWSQASTNVSFPTNLFPINTWGTYLTQTTTDAYDGGTILYARARSRDALDNQSNWPINTIVVPTVAPYPTIHIDGPYQERIVDGASASCTSMSVNESSLVLQPSVPAYVTPICTKRGASYSCNFVIDNQTPANACVSNSITIGMGGSYSGYSGVGWLAGESCSGASSTFPLTAGQSRPNIPLFITYDATGQQGWFKVSNTSFVNRSTGVRANFIPHNILKFDLTDDASTHNFSIKNAGIVDQQSPLNVGANSEDPSGDPIYSTPNIYTNGYSHTNDVDYDKYVQYIKARKGYVTKNSIAEIQENGVYFISSPIALNAASTSLFNDKKLVLITEGANNVAIGADFNPTNASIAFVSPSIAISSTVKSIDAILIAKTIQTGESSTELKINGNIVSQTVLAFQRKRTNPQMPSLYVDFNVKMFVDLLPYLSVSTYDWKQTQ